MSRMYDDAFEENADKMLKAFDESAVIAKEIGRLFKSHTPSLMAAAFAMVRTDLALAREDSEWDDCLEAAKQFLSENFSDLSDRDHNNEIFEK